MDATLYASLTDLYKNSGTVVTWETTTASVTKVVAAVGPDGTVKFGGLGEGVYTITETKTPDGYNGLKAPMTLSVVFHEDTETFEYSWTGGATGAGASITVDNMKGSVLPETGGMGTTLFYVIGGLLFAGAAVLLVTKKRMTAE
jgi:LPXTG-motif cell wall-anchored protein